MHFVESVSCPGPRFSKVLVTFRARKAVFVCPVCIQDQGIDDFKNDHMKLPIDEAKLTGLWARNCTTVQQILIWNLPLGPKRYRAFRETRPLVLKEIAQNHRVRTQSWILEKFLKFAQRFSRPGKSLENGGKVWKNDEMSWVFFPRLNKCFISEFCFILVKYYSISPVRLQRVMKKASFLRFLKSPC